MNWGGFAALSLDPRNRGMGMVPNPGLGKNKPWKGTGVTKSEWKAQKKSFKEQYTGGTKQEIKSDIEALREKKHSAESKAERHKLKAQIQAMEAAKRSLRRSGGFIKKSPAAGLPLPDTDDTTTTPTEPPDETPPPDQMQDVINSDSNQPVSGGSGGDVSVTLPGDSGGSSTGRTVWDLASDVTGDNKMLLIGGAAIVAYFLFFRKKR